MPELRIKLGQTVFRSTSYSYSSPYKLFDREVFGPKKRQLGNPFESLCWILPFFLLLFFIKQEEDAWEEDASFFWRLPRPPLFHHGTRLSKHSHLSRGQTETGFCWLERTACGIIIPGCFEYSLDACLCHCRVMVYIAAGEAIQLKYVISQAPCSYEHKQSNNFWRSYMKLSESKGEERFVSRYVQHFKQDILGWDWKNMQAGPSQMEIFSI